MNNKTILNWDYGDPKAVYALQLIEHPLIWDRTTETWAIYSYNYCKTILQSEYAHIPAPGTAHDSLLNDTARILIKKLARLSNNDSHAESRQATMIIYKNMKPVSINSLLGRLIADIKLNQGFDWIAVVGKKLPVLVILKGLGFSEEECTFVVDNISHLVKIMSPDKTTQDVAAINSVIGEFYSISERYISAVVLNSDNTFKDQKWAELLACNLLGLFIQCYDAGRGILCNALLSVVNYHRLQRLNAYDLTYFRKIVVETLRLDPPVHNTRRIAVKDICVGDRIIKAGQKILVVMAAANLDPFIFKDPELYDPLRNNNEEHLTFGLGGHMCLAKHLVIDMAAETFRFLTNKYTHISVLRQEFKYEPQSNVRLIKELIISLS